MENIDKICTTQMGIIRIKKNLELEVKDVVEWCKYKIKQSKNIVRKERIGMLIQRIQ
jgi:hypothetical protein